MKAKSVLITGGAGFIGSNLAKLLTTQSPDVFDVRVIDDLSTGRRENLAGVDVSFVEGSILDEQLLGSVADGVDSIVHLAALGSVPRSIAAPRPTHEANVTGTLNVLEAARNLGIDHVIVASSSSVYGANTRLPKSEFDWTRPMSPYAVTKQATEAYALAYGYSYGMNTLAFRFFNVFGPGQPADHAYAAVIPRFLDAAFSGRSLQIHGDGLQSRDFTYVDTVCSAIRMAIDGKMSSSDPVNLAFGSNTTILNLVERLEKILDRKLILEHTVSRSGDVRASLSDGIRVRELFPALRAVDLDEGLSRTAAWFQSSYVNG